MPSGVRAPERLVRLIGRGGGMVFEEPPPPYESVRLAGRAMPPA
jgi:hypothetical protein